MAIAYLGGLGHAPLGNKHFIIGQNRKAWSPLCDMSKEASENLPPSYEILNTPLIPRVPLDSSLDKRKHISWVAFACFFHLRRFTLTTDEQNFQPGASTASRISSHSFKNRLLQRHLRWTARPVVVAVAVSID